MSVKQERHFSVCTLVFILFCNICHFRSNTKYSGKSLLKVVLVNLHDDSFITICLHYFQCQKRWYNIHRQLFHCEYWLWFILEPFRTNCLNTSIYKRPKTERSYVKSIVNLLSQCTVNLRNVKLKTLTLLSIMVLTLESYI